MSFYRIYRPQVFEELDNIRVRETLLSLLHKEKKELPHAYLFSGPRGTGKTTAARLIAKLFQCEKPRKNGEPCGSCDQCRAIAKGTAIDVLEIDAASNTGVDNIRDLRDKIMLAPSVAKWKVYIIDEVHMLSTGAFNALLKTLEEPPEHAVFILATTDLQKVPLTIVSRCMHIAFTRPASGEIIGALKRIIEKEKITINKEALDVIADAADGSFRDAVKFLEQVSFSKGNITAAVAAELLSLSDQQLAHEFITFLSHKDAKNALGTISQLVEKGKDIKTFLVGILGLLERQLITWATEGSFTLSPSEGHTSSSFGSREELTDAIRRLSGAYAEIKGSSIAQLPLELAVVEFCSKDDLRIKKEEQHKTERPKAEPISQKIEEKEDDMQSLGMLTIEKLTECWKDFIEALKPFNHSVAGVLRSARPKDVKHGIVTIEAFYKFHQEKLLEPKTRDILATVLKKLFGEKVKVEIVLGKK